MKLTKLLVFVMLFSVAVFAQRGGHGAGSGHVGAPPSGAGNMGSGHDMGRSTMGKASSHQSMGQQSPSEVLSHNTKLSSNLEKMLPSGMTADQACSGFKTLGECVSTIHVAHNLDIPFADLKTKTTGDNSVSLGKAITELKPGVDAKAETKKAQKQANQDLNRQ